MDEAEKNLIEKNKSKKKKIKKRKRGRYITGFHVSPKCKQIFEYRSGWEKIFAKELDNDPNVVSYEYETIKIPYVLNNTTGRIRFYYPDFIVTYADGSKTIIEVKNTNALKNIMVIKKAKAAELWAKRNGYQYQIISGDVIQKLELKYGKVKRTIPKTKK